MTSTTTMKMHRGFRGHTVASNNDSSILLATSLTESLVRNRKFDQSDVLAGYLYAVHENVNSFDKITTKLYQLVREDRMSIEDNQTLTRESFRVNPDAAAALCFVVDSIFDEHTGTCEPSQRSFPLAFCPFITDDDLYEVSLQEAALTHTNPLAGQVSGVFNVICRGLLRRKSWRDAVTNAFRTPRLSTEVTTVEFSAFRQSCPVTNCDSSYATHVLYQVLTVITESSTFQEAISGAKRLNNRHILPLVGLLAGIRSDSDQEIMGKPSYGTNFDQMRSLIDDLGSTWPHGIGDITA